MVEEDFKSRLLAARAQAIGLRSDDHWLRLNSLLRTTLEFGFDNGQTDKEISQILQMGLSIIGRWRQQREQIKLLKDNLARLKRPGKQKLSSATLYRPDVASLARIIPARILARELKIAYSTIQRWHSEEWDLVGAVKSKSTSGNKKAEADKPLTLAASEILKSPEGLELFNSVKRHEGKTRKKYSIVERKHILALVEKFGSKEVHQIFGVSFDTISRMIKRQIMDIERKTRVPLRYAPVLDLMKQHPGIGPMQMRDYLRRNMGLSMSVNSIRNVMEQNGWVPPFVKSPRVKEGVQLYEAIRRNYLWHTDFKHQYINSCKLYLIFVQDDYSRFIVNYGISDGEKVDTVVRTFDQAIRLHGKPEVIMSDGGSAFFSWRGVSQFTRFLEDYGIDQIVAKTPNVNGKLENLNQQVEKELLLTQNFSSLEHFSKSLSAWVGFYNFRRAHQGIGGHQVPADRYYPGAMTWYGETGELTRQQSLIAETMATLLGELKKKS